VKRAVATSTQRDISTWRSYRQLTQAEHYDEMRGIGCVSKLVLRVFVSMYVTLSSFTRETSETFPVTDRLPKCQL
jgi:hypothetical protein